MNIHSTIIYSKLSKHSTILAYNKTKEEIVCLEMNSFVIVMQYIANVLSMSKSSISHQLGTLRRSGIVKCKRVGKEVFYMLDDEHVKKVFEIGVEHIEHRI